MQSERVVDLHQHPRHATDGIEVTEQTHDAAFTHDRAVLADLLQDAGG